MIRQKAYHWAHGGPDHYRFNHDRNPSVAVTVHDSFPAIVLLDRCPASPDGLS